MIDALELGKAAEHLVCADIILAGHRAQLSSQGMPYDVIADIRGKLYRVQVKATTKAKNVSSGSRVARTGYSFYVRRRGKFGSKRIGADECDLVALVAIDIRQIAYLPIEVCGQTVQLLEADSEARPTSGKGSGKGWGQRIDGFSLEAALSGDTAAYREMRSQCTHCVHGHEYTPENTIINTQGAKQCLECRRKSGREAAARRAADRRIQMAAE